MKAIFSIVSLLIVLGIVGSLVKKQLHAMNGSTTHSVQSAGEAGSLQSRDGATQAIPGGLPGAEAADPNAISVPQQTQAVQQKVRADTARALQQGTERNKRAEP